MPFTWLDYGADRLNDGVDMLRMNEHTAIHHVFAGHTLHDPLERDLEALARGRARHALGKHNGVGNVSG